MYTSQIFDSWTYSQVKYLTCEFSQVLAIGLANCIVGVVWLGVAAILVGDWLVGVHTD